MSWQRDERSRGREEEKNRTPQTALKESPSVKEVNGGDSCVGGLERRVGRREKESGKNKRYLLDGLLFIFMPFFFFFSTERHPSFSEGGLFFSQCECCMSQCSGPTHYPCAGQRTGREKRAGSSCLYALLLLDRYTSNKL